MSELNRPMEYDDYDRDWKRKHRSSIPRRKRASSMREYFWITFWIVVASGAAIFSAAHTIPAAEMTIFASVPNRNQLAVTAFVIVELVIFGAAAGRREIKWLTWLLIASVLVALAGNISSSVRAVAENGGDILNQFGGVLLAIIAPITALAAGEVLHIQLDKRAAKQRAADELYEESCKELEARINRDYTRYLKGFGTDSRQTAPGLSVSEQTDRQADRQTAHSGYGHTRTPDGQTKVIEYLTANPDHASYPSRKLADLIGVGHDTANKGRNTWQKSHYSNGTNGHKESGDATP